jgi:sigma-B regulation protein RsbU (phosphoserine phosphatase)
MDSEARYQQRSAELSSAYEALQAKNDEIQRDMEAARRVQLQLLPQESELPQREEIEFAGHYQSKDRVGGDLYDFIRIGMNSWGFLVADVSGHGVPSALLTMFLKAAFRTRVRWGVASDQVCREVNAVLNPVVRDLGLFVTAFFGILDLETATFRYTNCGHPPVFLRRASTGELVRLEEKGMILGPFDEIEVEQDEIAVEEGDVLLAVTDGVLEARNFLDEMYGLDRLTEAFRQEAPPAEAPEGTLGPTIAALRRHLEAFTMGAVPDDDLTLAAFRFRHRAPEKGQGAGSSDVAEDRVRKDRILAAGLRRRAREAYSRGSYRKAHLLLDALGTLDTVGSSDLLLQALVFRKLGQAAEAVWAAEAALGGLTPGSTRERLARKILGRGYSV